jgi:hypothetical protein
MSTALHRQRKGQRRKKPELGHDPIPSTVPIDSIRPAPENDKLYRPVDPHDPSIKSLANSIKKLGIQEPLVVTQDGWILSGHRRHVAARLAGLHDVPCRIESFRREDDPARFLTLLREFNRQRVKSLDEQLREEVVSCDPKEAYCSLIAYRDEKAAQAVANADAIVITRAKERSAISAAKQPLLDAIKRVIQDQKKFWPLTDRRIHYALLNNPPLIHARKPGSRYANTPQSYKACVELLTRARLAGEIPMDCIDDATRPVTVWNVHENVQDFIRHELNGFLKGYWRDLMQSQPVHVEVVAEKNTVAPILKPVAERYCIPLTSGRGYCSLPPRHAMSKRFLASGKQRLVLLLVSDFDPDGEQIAESFASSMRRDFGITNITAIKVALTGDQTNVLALPPALKAKKTSTNYAKFNAKYGDDVYELEAVPPEKLQEILADAIDSVLDVDLFNAEIFIESKDAAFLENTRRRTQAALTGVVCNTA